MEMNNDWEEIDGFNSPGEYRRFCTHIEKQVASGDALERAVDPNYGKGMIFGGRWFEDRGTKQIWRLVPPDFLFRGLWEKVDLNAN
jgi:hypothetical protein